MHDGLCPPTDSRREPASAIRYRNTPHRQKETDMVNRNGSNNGHNGNGTGNGLVHVNGNGHKPDAAIVSEHELLWDGLSPAVSQALGQPLDPALASQRKGRAGRSYDYLEGHAVIDQANRIFGYGGWGYELAGDVTLRQDRDGRHPDGRGEGLARLQRPGAGHRGGRAAPHRHRRPPGGRGHLRRPRHGHQGRGHGRHEAGVPQLRRPVRQRVLRRPAAGWQPAATAARPRSEPAPYWKRANGNSGQNQAKDRAASPRSKSCGSGSSRSPPSRASTRTRCGAPSRTGRARASTTWTAAELGPLVEAAANKLRQMQQAQAA